MNQNNYNIEDCVQEVTKNGNIKIHRKEKLCGRKKNITTYEDTKK